MTLTATQREELADRLYESTLPQMPGEEVSPEEAEAAWAEEIKRRSDDYHAGNTETLDAFESLEKLRRELARATEDYHEDDR